MRRLIASLAVVALLGGCAQLQSIGTAIQLGTASIANPVTKTREAQIEAGFDAALQLLLAYRRECIAGHADTHCRGNIALVQPYTRQAAVLIKQLRSFVDTNDQVNAIVVYNQLVALYGDMKSVAATAGVNVGALP